VSAQLNGNVNVNQYVSDIGKPANVPLIQEISPSGMTLQETVKKNHFAAQTATISTKPVQLNHLPAKIPSNSLYFTLPGTGQNYTARGSYMYRRSDSDYMWWGAVDNRTGQSRLAYEQPEGYFGMISNASGKFAFVQDGNRVFYLHTLSSRYNLLTEIQVSDSGDDHPPTDTAFKEESPVLICDEDENCSAVVSVLVLVPIEAQNWLGGNTSNWLESALYVMLGLNTINYALLNSGVNNRSLRFTIEPFSFQFSDPQQLDLDLSALRNNSNAFARKTATRSDIMLLLTDNRYNGHYGQVESLSKTGLPSYGIVRINDLLTPRFTFAHELAHCFGALHNRAENGGDQSDADPDCKFGYRFDLSGQKDDRTIMSFLPRTEVEQGFRRVMHFSNPEVLYRGIATGTDRENNARVISQMMCKVKDYFEDAELNANIIGPDIIGDCDGTVYSASIVDGPEAGAPGGPPYTYSWRVDNDPILTTNYFFLNDWGTEIGTGPSVVINASNRLPGGFSLRLLISGSEGVFISTAKQIVNPCDNFFRNAGPGLNSRGNAAGTASFELYPNPATGAIQMKTGMARAEQGEVFLTDALGKKVAEFTLPAGSNEQIFDSRHLELPGGFYTVTLHTGKEIFTQKLIIQN
jgi:Secretion system C-terminal sorting domain